MARKVNMAWQKWLTLLSGSHGRASGAVAVPRNAPKCPVFFLPRQIPVDSSACARRTHERALAVSRLVSSSTTDCPTLLTSAYFPILPSDYSDCPRFTLAYRQRK